MSEFSGSYIEVILSIASTDKHCALSFVPSDLVNARKELIDLRAERDAYKVECDNLQDTKDKLTNAYVEVCNGRAKAESERDAYKAQKGGEK